MKNITVGIVLVVALLPLRLLSQQKSGFEIDGVLGGLKNGEMIKLANRFADFHYPSWMDSCKVIDGKFKLKGEFVPGGPRIYEIWFDEGHHRVRNVKGDGNIGGMDINLFLDNGDQVKIAGGDINKMQNADFENEVLITGSPTNLAKRLLLPVIDSFFRCYSLINRRLNTVRDSIGFDKSFVQRQIDARLKLDSDVYLKLSKFQSNSYKVTLPYLLGYIDNYHNRFLKNLYENLKESIHDSYYGKILKANSDLAIGQALPEFSLPSYDGKEITLKEIVSKSKVTLVHLWASNSYEREKYQQELKIMYKQYHDKGLNIIGVSADTSADDWKFMIHQKQYPWPNVSDLKGWGKGSIIQDVYHEGGHSIPNTTNILLDEKGRIIAWDANGVELQWYLWKYLGE